MTRQCDGCTKCCEGWLEGNVYGHDFFRGRPCFFLNKKCSIYESRPHDPCRVYRCAWLDEDIFPQWMKPDISNVIITKRQHDNIEFYEIIEAGSVLESKVLNWLVHWALNNAKNVIYTVNGGVNRIGSKEFMELNFESK